MSGNRQQQTHTKELMAGVPLNIDQPCEFVFVDQGEDLDFTVGDSRLSGRRAGDFARFDRPVSSVRVVSPRNQVIKLVLGFGEFSRLIVSGELNVSAYVKTAQNGVAKSLPSEIKRTVGGTLGETQYTRDTVEYTSQNVGNANITPGCFWFLDRFYMLGGTSQEVVTFKPDSVDGAYEEAYPATGGYDLLQAFGAAPTPAGVIYWRDNAGHLYKMSMGVWASQVVAWNVYTVNHYKRGMHYFDGRLYTLNDAGSGIESVNLDGGDLRTELIFGGPAANQLMAVGNLMFVDGGGLYAQRCLRFGPGGALEVYTQGDMEAAETVSGETFAISTDRLYALKKTGSGTVTVVHLRTIKTYGEIYFEPPGDTARRVVVPLYDPPVSFIGPGGVSITYDWVSVILSNGEGEADYLDYLTGYQYDSGIVSREVSSGTQTFSYRGIEVGPFPVLDGSEVAIKILPEFFDQ